MKDISTPLRLLRAVVRIALVAALTAAGCGKTGPELAPVRGQVTLDGQPLPIADVYFHPEGEKSPSVGRTDSEGRYTLGYKRGVEGGMIGWNTVRIQTVRGKPLVPSRYNRDTDLRREVKPGKNTIDFELKTVDQ